MPPLVATSQTSGSNATLVARAAVGLKAEMQIARETAPFASAFTAQILPGRIRAGRVSDSSTLGMEWPLVFIPRGIKISSEQTNTSAVATRGFRLVGPAVWKIAADAESRSKLISTIA